MYFNKISKYTFIVFLVFLQQLAYAQLMGGASISGPSTVQTGSTHTYTYSGLEPMTYSWSVSNGAVISQSSSTVTIRWGGYPGSGTVNYNGGRYASASYSVQLVAPPTQPSASNKSRCGTGSLTLTASGAPGGGGYRWYSSSSSTTPIKTGSSYTTPSLSSNRYYYVTAYSSEGFESTRRRVLAIINAVPSSPTAYNKSRCGTGNITFTASGASSGASYRWYNSAGTYVGTGSSYTTPSLSSNTYYRVSLKSSAGCEGPKKTVYATINSLPSTPSASNKSRCGAGNLTLTASGAPSGGNYRWYSASSGGSVLKTGNSYTLYVSSTRNYYVAAVSSNGCESAVRRRVTATINSVPGLPTANTKYRCGGGSITLSASGAPTNGTYRWYADNIGGSVLATGNSLTKTISANTTYYVSAVSSSGCEGNRRAVQAIIQTAPTPPAVKAYGNNFCGSGAVTFKIEPDQSNNIYVYKWYASETATQALATGTSYSTGTLSSNKTYYVSRDETGACESNRLALPIIVNPKPTVLPTASDKSRCGEGSLTLIAAGAPSGGNYRWYAASSGGSPLKTGSSYAVSISSTRNYYVATVSSKGCESASRRKVTATVNPVPGKPTANNSYRCGSGSVTLTATGDSNTNGYRWYASSVGGSVLGTGNTFTETISSTTTYYVSGVSSLGCEGNRRAVQAIIQIAPTPPAVTTYGNNFCGSGAVTFTIEPDQSSTIYEYKWYASETATQALATGTSYSTGSLSTSKTFYVSRDETGACESDRLALPVIVNPKPTALPDASNMSRCDEGSLTLTASGAPSGYNYVWYDQASGGSPLTTSSTYTTGTLTSTKNYYVALISDKGCIGPRKMISAIINSFPEDPTALGVTACEDEPFTLSASSNGNTLEWYADAQGSQFVYEGNELAVSGLSNDKDYWVKAVNASNCSSSLVKVTALINKRPRSPIIVENNVTLCNSGSFMFLVESGVRPEDAGGTIEMESTVFNWYASLTDTEVLSNGNFFEMENMTSSRTVYVSELNPETNCESDRVAVNLIVEPVPSIQGGNSINSFYSGTVETMSIVPINSAQSYTYNWYAGDENGPLVHTGTSWTTEINGSASYYVKAETAGGCESPEAFKVTKTLWETPEIYSVGGSLLTNGSSITLKTTQQYETYYWFKDGQEVANTPSLVVSSPGVYELKVGVSNGGGLQQIKAMNKFPVVYDNQIDDKGFYYVHQIVSRKEGIKVPAEFQNLNSSEKAESIQYMDATGRAVQSISIASNPMGQDMVSFQEYGDYGRQYKQYMAFAAEGANGSFREQADSLQALFYKNTSDAVADSDFPFSEVVYDNTPYGQVIESSSVGESWQMATGHTMKTEQRFSNASDGSVRKFDAQGLSTEAYAEGDLQVGILTDVEDRKSFVFTNELGQTVLKRTPGDTMGVFTETYYVYDVYGRVTHIIAPLAVEKMSDANNYNVNNYPELIFSFQYDHKSRVVERKVPGKGAEYIIYDEWNRPILTQNALLRKTDQWQFAKYDEFMRPVMFGLYTNDIDTTREAMQALVDAIDYDNGAIYYEIRTANAYGYTTDQSFPSQALTIQSINYYDDYDLDRDEQADISYDPSHLAGSISEAYSHTFGMPTATKQKLLYSNVWLTSAYFYDEDGRIIQTRSNNIQNENIADISTAIYDWEGKLLRSKSSHHGKEQVQIKERYTYDHMGRVLEVHHQVGEQTEQMIAQYNYNALGQLIEKNLHQEANGFLQSVDLRYHIKGWLKSVNQLDLAADANDSREDFFAMEFQYEENNSGKYDGSITAIGWKNVGEQNLSMYEFSYDQRNQLIAADFSKVGGDSGNAFDMNASYDANGNISTLQRYNESELMDDLAYEYGANNNQLISVTDAAIEEGFKDGEDSGNDYSYDENGNLLEDKNKGITSVEHNYMDKPDRVLFEDGSSILNTYTAGGLKIRQTYIDSLGDQQKQTEYLGKMVYQDSTIQFISIADGRIVKDQFAPGSWEYQYHITDHLGNVRSMFTTKPKSLTFSINYEDVDSAKWQNEFSNVDQATIDKSDLYDHTDSISPAVYTNAQLLSGAESSVVGSVLSIPVKPGDTVNAQVFATYQQPESTSNPLAAVGQSLIAALLGNTGTGSAVEGSINNSYGSTGSLVSDPSYNNSIDQSVPKAFINLLFLPDNPETMISASNFKFSQITNASDRKHALLALQESFTAPESGVVVIYLSNESDNYTPVYFDDMEVTVNQSNILQVNDYFPYGMQQSTSFTRSTSIGNKYLFNAGSELNSKTQNYETFYRNYDPALGRFNGVDIKASSYTSLTPYQFAGNNPINANDPMGDRISWKRVQWESSVGHGRHEPFPGMAMNDPDYSGYRGGGGTGYSGRSSYSTPTSAARGNDWAAQYRGANGNAIFMYRHAWREMYGINNMTSQEKTDFAKSISTIIFENSQFNSNVNKKVLKKATNRKFNKGSEVGVLFGSVKKIKLPSMSDLLVSGVGDQNGGMDFYYNAVDGMTLKNGQKLTRDNVLFTNMSFEELKKLYPELTREGNANYLGLKNGKHHVNFTIENYEITKANIQNLVVHEVFSHGIQGYGDDTKDHYKAYFDSIDHSSWGETTESYRIHTAQALWLTWTRVGNYGGMPNKYMNVIYDYHPSYK